MLSATVSPQRTLAEESIPVDLTKPSGSVRVGGTTYEWKSVPLSKTARIEQADKLMREGNPTEAERILQELLQEEEEQTGKNSIELASLLRGIGAACLLQGKLPEAESSLLRGIDLQLKNAEEPTEDLAYDMRLLGQTYSRQGKVADAQSMFALGLGAIDRVYKDDSKPLKLRIELLDLLADTLQKQQQWSKAEPLLERLHKLQTLHQLDLKITHKDIADTQKRLEDVKSAEKELTNR